MIRHRSLGRKQGQLRWPLAPFIECFDDLAPRLAPAVIDLAQIQHLPLHDLATSTALALDNIPIAMLLAVLQSSVASQIHASESVSNACKQALRKTKLLNRYLVYTTAVSNSSRLVSTRIFRSSSQKNQLFRPSLEKVGLGLRIVQNESSFRALPNCQRSAERSNGTEKHRASVCLSLIVAALDLSVALAPGFLYASVNWK